MDFGIARLAGADTMTAEGELLGTVAYMSPEQAAGRRVGPATDVYSAGVLLYELLAGSNPVRGATAGETVGNILAGRIAPLETARPDLPAELCDAVAAACSLRRPRPPGGSRPAASLRGLAGRLGGGRRLHPHGCSRRCAASTWSPSAAWAPALAAARWPRCSRACPPTRPAGRCRSPWPSSSSGSSLPACRAGLRAGRRRVPAVQRLGRPPASPTCLSRWSCSSSFGAGRSCRRLAGPGPAARAAVAGTLLAGARRRPSAAAAPPSSPPGRRSSTYLVLALAAPARTAFAGYQAPGRLAAAPANGRQPRSPRFVVVGRAVVSWPCLAQAALWAASRWRWRWRAPGTPRSAPLAVVAGLLTFYILGRALPTPAWRPPAGTASCWPTSSWRPWSAAPCWRWFGRPPGRRVPAGDPIWDDA